MRQEPHILGPVLILDAAVIRGVLEQLAPEVYVPPTDASLRLEGDRFVAMPSRPGRVLDVEAALGKVMTAFGGLGTDSHIALPFQAVPPRLADATAVQAQAEEMLNRQITISAYDTSTDEFLAWALARDTITTWLRVERTQDGRDLEVLDRSAAQDPFSGCTDPLHARARQADRHQHCGAEHARL